MAFLAGVDEAGYGPLLGPFVLGWSLFRVPRLDLDLWKVTGDAASSRAGRRGRQDRRLWVDDSKLVHSGPAGRGRLERSVAAFRELAAPGAPELEAWLFEAPAGATRWFDLAPWFHDLAGPLCPHADGGRRRLDAAALGRALDHGGCQLIGFGARAAPAGEWNHLLARHDSNKGAVLWAITAEILRHVLAMTGDAPLRVELDRHGGRSRYAAPLRAALQPREVVVHGETAQASVYTLRFERRAVEIRFSEDGDRRFFPVALASLAAKQTRERLMDLWNAWFEERLPAVAPTRGYALDAKRWLAEAGPHLAALGVAEALLRRRR